MGRKATRGNMARRFARGAPGWGNTPQSGWANVTSQNEVECRKTEMNTLKRRFGWKPGDTIVREATGIVVMVHGENRYGFVLAQAGVIPESRLPHRIHFLPSEFPGIKMDDGITFDIIVEEKGFHAFKMSPPPSR